MSKTPPPIREPQLLRFRLRQMFLFVTLLSVFCTLLVLTKGPWPLVILCATLLVGAHVLGTLIGTRLRDNSSDIQRWRAVNTRLDVDKTVANLTITERDQLDLPPTTPLADQGFTNRWLIWFVLAGALLGVIVGGATIWITVGYRIGWAGWAVGTLSCGVLGTWTAFLASSFSAIARHAWRHASEKGK